MTWDAGSAADADTLDELGEILGALAGVSGEAAAVERQVRSLRRACDRAGRLPSAQRHHLGAIIEQLEARLG